MSIYAATRAELEGFSAVGGVSVAESVEGQVALNLAGILDDRDGIQSGGVASTAKQFLAVMGSLREQFAPKKKGRLELLRGGTEQAS